MRITSITITNMAAFRSFEAKLPAVALIQGSNGQGKTSLLDCLKYAFGRGHNEDMIHGDAPEGEIAIEFDTGAGVRCRAVRDRQETVRSWRAPGSKRFLVSREQIDAIANALSYDPLAFLNRTEKEQVEILLRIMPIECGEEELATAIGGISAEPVTGNAIERIESTRDQFYFRRRECNAFASTQERHAGELEKALPPPAPDGADWNAETSRLRAEKERLESQRSEKLALIKTLFETEKESARDECENAVQTAAAARDERIEVGRLAANQAASALNSAHSPLIQELERSLATAEERARAHAEAEGTRKAAETAGQKAAQYRETSASLSAAMERLDQLKTAVAARLPIKGVTIQNGRILREEAEKLVPFSRWNTASKMSFCLRIAVLAHGEAGLICIDGAEVFDSEKRVALLQAAERYAANDGLQFIIASVADTPLTVSSPGE